MTENKRISKPANRPFRDNLPAIAAGVCLLINLTALVAADDFDTAAAPPPPRRVLESGALLLKNGRVVEGRIILEGGEYRVEKSRGELFVPADSVRHVCLDLTDAYRVQRDARKKPTAADHVVLARWCLGQNLLEEARIELRAAVDLEPARVDCRRMLRRLNSILDPPSSSTTTSTTTIDGAGDEELESLGGLSSEDAQNFVTRIQPILVNTCGNARCHGGDQSEREFSLIHVRAGRLSSRRSTQRNLATVFQQINFDDPTASPLLADMDGAHGGAKLVFRGRSGRQQLRELREWVLSVANQKTGRALEKKDLRRQLRETLTGDAPRRLPTPPSVTKERNIEQTRALKELTDTTDNFDPAEFNRSVAE